MKRKQTQRAYLDALLDQALEETFPASDPVAIAIEHEPSPGVSLRPRMRRRDVSTDE